MGKLILSLALICFIHADVVAQEQVSIGTYRKITSAVLKGEVSYIEHLPDSYDKKTDAYPVVFLLNGQSTANFANAAATMDNLASDRTPDMILIGIVNEGVAAKYGSCPDDSGRILEAVAFCSFLERELIPEISKRYRTNRYRILAGQSNSGLFALHVMLNRPELFDAYVIASPMLGWCPDFYLNEAAQALRANPSLAKKLYISYGELDYVEVLGRIGDFEQVYRQQAPPSLTWRIEKIPNASHVPYITLNNALLFFFPDCTMTPERRKWSVDEVKAHFEQLSTEYGFTIRPKGDALADMALDLKNQKKFDDAILWFQYAIGLYPTTAIYHYGLGLTYYQKGEMKFAKEFVEQALKIDPEQSQSKRLLKKLNEAGI